jgi:hypothetical protein
MASRDPHLSLVRSNAVPRLASRPDRAAQREATILAAIVVVLGVLAFIATLGH